MNFAIVSSETYYIITQEDYLWKKVLTGECLIHFSWITFTNYWEKKTTKIKNNKNFAFPIDELGQNFVNIMNLQFFFCKIAGSYNAKDTLSTKSHTKDNIKNEHK